MQIDKPAVDLAEQDRGCGAPRDAVSAAERSFAAGPVYYTLRSAVHDTASICRPPQERTAGVGVVRTHWHKPAAVLL